MKKKSNIPEIQGQWSSMANAPKDGSIIIGKMGKVVGLIYWHSEWQWKTFSMKQAWMLVWQNGELAENAPVDAWASLPKA